MTGQQIVLALITLGAPVVGWIYLRVLRSFVTYQTLGVQFPRKSERYQPVDNPLGLMVFERIVFINQSWKSLKNVNLPFDHVCDVMLGEIRGSSIGKLESFSLTENELVFKIPELPRGERLTISFLHRGVGALGRRVITSGGNEYKLVPAQDYDEDQRLVKALLIALSMIVGPLWLRQFL